MSAREKSLCNVLNEPCNWDETQIIPTLTARNAGGVSVCLIKIIFKR